jgi:hypothetical protein
MTSLSSLPCDGVVVPLGPARADLMGVRAGDRNLVTVTLHRGDDPVDLTGITVTAQARKEATDQGPPALEAEVTITDAEAGEFELRWPGEDVRTMLAGAAYWLGVWDLQLDPGGEPPYTVLEGAFEAVQDVTRP